MNFNDFYEKKHFDLVNSSVASVFQIGDSFEQKNSCFLSPFATHIWRLKRSLECYHFSVDNCHIPISVSGTRILESHQYFNLRFGIQTKTQHNWSKMNLKCFDIFYYKISKELTFEKMSIIKLWMPNLKFKSWTDSNE